MSTENKSEYEKCFDERQRQQKAEKYTDLYLKTLEDIFEQSMYRIHFKPNQKYGPYEEQFPVLYIGFSDLMCREINIRFKKGNEYEDNSDPVIAHYSSLKELLLDGWELD